ncbi:MAG: C1 family peptidase [Rudaea sp.]|nr:C1 family peptidase [Rudaea sp.]
MKQASARKTLQRKQAWYGWVPDLPDKRDALYRSVYRIPARLPVKVDLRAQCPPVADQGQLGSCTANALAGALEFLELKGQQKLVDLSRLFIYYNERVIEHDVTQDSGAMIRDGIKSLASQGVCAESLWPYVISRFARKPTAACYSQAKQHSISSYQRLETTDEMRSCLAAGFPFVFGFTVYENFESAAVARSGVVNLPKPAERAIGGHAVCAVGYSDAQKRFIVRNSWGVDWGMAGYFTIPYVYLADRNLSDDFWTVRK